MKSDTPSSTSSRTSHSNKDKTACPLTRRLGGVLRNISKLFGNVFLFVWKNIYILYEKVAKCSCVDAIRKTVRIYRQLRLAQVFIHA